MKAISLQILVRCTGKVNVLFLLATVCFILKHGACANVADLWKFTPLHEAAAKGKFEICKLLLKVGECEKHLL